MPMKTVLKICFLIITIGCSKPSDDARLFPGTDQFFTCEIAGVKGSVTSPNDSLACYRMYARSIIGGDATASADHFILSFNGDQVPGTYTAVDCDLYLNGKRYSSMQNQTQIQVKVSRFGSRGDKITGSYSGTVSDSTHLYPVKGDFRLTVR